MKRKLVIGLTGGIASGKSFVINEFRKLGASIVDADKISRGILKPGTRESKFVLKRFGTVDRKKLGEIVFSDARKLKALEKIVHPGIIKRIKHEIKAKSRKKLTILDAPLLFEKKLEKAVDLSILVYLPAKIQLARLIRRNGSTKSEALKRISAQLPAKEKAKKADIIIDNTDAKTCVKEQINEIWNFFARIDKCNSFIIK